MSATTGSGPTCTPGSATSHSPPITMNRVFPPKIGSIGSAGINEENGPVWFPDAPDPSVSSAAPYRLCIQPNTAPPSCSTEPPNDPPRSSPDARHPHQHRGPMAASHLPGLGRLHRRHQPPHPQRRVPDRAFVENRCRLVLTQTLSSGSRRISVRELVRLPRSRRRSRCAAGGGRNGSRLSPACNAASAATSTTIVSRALTIGLAALPAADTAPTRKPPRFNAKRTPPGMPCSPGGFHGTVQSRTVFGCQPIIGADR